MKNPKFTAQIMVVKEMAIDLLMAETTRSVCPYCNAAHEKSLTVGRDKIDGHIWWRCFRAKCGWRGHLLPEHSHISTVTRVTPKVTIRMKWAGKAAPLSHKQRAELWLRWHFENTDYTRSGVQWTEEMGGRYVFPVYDMRGLKKGVVLRSMTKTPKTYTYLHRGNKTSWYYKPEFTRDRETWIVEDIPSAVRASRYVNAIALLGVDVNDEVVNEMANQVSNIVWALDEDAVGVAVQHWQNYRVMFKESRVEYLSKDLKDMSEIELKETLNVRTKHNSELYTEQGGT